MNVESDGPIDGILLSLMPCCKEPTLPPFQPDGYEQDMKLLADYREQLHHERTRTGNPLHADLSIA